MENILDISPVIFAFVTTILLISFTFSLIGGVSKYTSIFLGTLIISIIVTIVLMVISSDKKQTEITQYGEECRSVGGYIEVDYKKLRSSPIENAYCFNNDKTEILLPPMQ